MATPGKNRSLVEVIRFGGGRVGHRTGCRGDVAISGAAMKLWLGVNEPAGAGEPATRGERGGGTEPSAGEMTGRRWSVQANTKAAGVAVRVLRRRL